MITTNEEINTVLNNKFNEWVASIEDPTVQTLVRSNTIITGGAIVSLLLKEQIKDFDVYFKNKETALAVAIYYVNKFNAGNSNRKFMVVDGDTLPDILGYPKWKRLLIKDVLPGQIRIISLARPKKNYDPEAEYTRDFDGIDDHEEHQDHRTQLGLEFDEIDDHEDEPSSRVRVIEKPKENYKPCFLSHNAVTLSGKVQLITRFYGTAEQIHENFDFAHCTNYWESDSRSVTFNPKALSAIESKELRYVGSRFPLCSAMRVDKFIIRGWKIDQHQWSKIAAQVLALDLEDPDELRKQMAGYYSDTFNVLAYEINQLKLELDDDISVKDIMELIKQYT